MENVGPLLNRAATLVTQDMEEAEVLNTFFASVFSSITGLQESQALEIKGKVWSKEYVPVVEEEQVGEYLNKLDIQKSLGPDGRHPRVLRKLAGLVVRSLLVVFE